MDFLVNRDKILETIEKVRHFAEKEGRGTFSWSSSVKISASKDSLFFEVFSIDTPTVMFRLNIGVNVKEQGYVLIPCKLLHSTLLIMPEKSVINFTSSHTEVKIKQGRKIIKLPIFHSEFPDMKDLSSVEFKKIPDLHKKVSNILYATKEDLTEITRGCVYINNGFVVATDGHRLAYSTISDNTINNGLISASAFSKLAKAFTKDEQEVLEVYNDDSCIYFKSGDGVIGIRKKERNYYNWQRILPNISITKEVLLDKTSLLNSVKVVALASDSSMKRMILKFQTDGTVRLYASNKENSMEAEETLTYKGDMIDMTLGVNSNYLIETVEHLYNAEISLRLISPMEKLIFIEGDTTQLIMPLKIHTV